MRLLRSFQLLLSGTAVVSALSAVSDDTPSTTTHVPKCTATSSTGSGAFFDLRPDTASAKSKSSSVTKDYHSRGYDYGKNFTLNICGAMAEPVMDVVGVDEKLWANVSAYYTSHGNTYSIGSTSLDLTSRGRKLVLQYSGGSPCGEKASSLRIGERDAPTLYDDEEAELRAQYGSIGQLEDLHSSSSSSSSDLKDMRRKSTTISFLCDRDPGSTQAAISFVGTDPDECAYFFEARSVHACAHAEPHKPGSVGPGSIFGLILIIAVLVYMLGGVFYNRTVTHARGWRQLPNYSLWAGIWGFICDMFIIAISSCSRHLPSRRGYDYVNSSPSSRNRNAEAENRLIDQLDEEWDD